MSYFALGLLTFAVAMFAFGSSGIVGGAAFVANVAPFATVAAALESGVGAVLSHSHQH